jgi:hypothetical protein
MKERTPDPDGAAYYLEAAKTFKVTDRIHPAVAGREGRLKPKQAARLQEGAKVVVEGSDFFRELEPEPEAGPGPFGDVGMEVEAGEGIEIEDAPDPGFIPPPPMDGPDPLEGPPSRPRRDDLEEN